MIPQFLTVRKPIKCSPIELCVAIDLHVKSDKLHVAILEACDWSTCTLISKGDYYDLILCVMGTKQQAYLGHWNSGTM